MSRSVTVFPAALITFFTNGQLVRQPPTRRIDQVLHLGFERVSPYVRSLALGRVLDVAAPELDGGGAGEFGVAARESEHVLAGVDPVDAPGGADAAGGEQYVEAAAGAEVEHDVAFGEVGDGDGVAAAEADGQRALDAWAAVGVRGGAEAAVVNASGPQSRVRRPSSADRAIPPYRVITWSRICSGAGSVMPILLGRGPARAGP